MSKLQTRLQSWVDALDRFLFSPASPYPLAILRLALSAVLLAQAVLIAPSLLDLYGQNGLLQERLNSYALAALLPVYFDWTSIAAHLHVSLDHVMQGVFVGYVAALAALFAGYRTRWAAFFAWFGHFVLMMNQGFKSSYGVDTFANIFLWYLVLFPCGAALSLDRLRLGGAPPVNAWNRFAIRVMQLHLAIAYCTSGIAKFQGPQWHSGEVIWRALMLPQFSVFNLAWLANYAWIPLAFAWGTLVLEIGYPMLLGWRRTRLYGALGILSMHAGIAIFMGLWSFALVMIALTGSLFLVPAEPPRGAVAA